MNLSKMQYNQMLVDQKLDPIRSTQQSTMVNGNIFYIVAQSFSAQLIINKSANQDIIYPTTVPLVYAKDF